MTWWQITVGLILAGCGAVLIVAVCSRINDGLSRRDEHEEGGF